jgi:amidophosphoribosyltransferase
MAEEMNNLSRMLRDDDHFHDECGVIGIYSPGDAGIARDIYFGLHSLQHRGQESAGIAVNRYGNIDYHKGMGLVQEVFSDDRIRTMQGDIAIGHVRYSTTGASLAGNAQPLVVFFKGGAIALGHNGNLVNSNILRDELQEEGYLFQTTIDTEVLAAYIARNIKDGDIEGAIAKTMEIAKGAYALVITSGEKLIGVRDPLGLRPLVLGKTKNGYVLSSETCNFNLLGAEKVRDIDPGEIITIENGEISSMKFDFGNTRKTCSFEYVYFARPDSVMDGRSIYLARHECGRNLAKEQPAAADVVIAVPDSGNVAAMGYAEQSGIPFGIGLIKNRYVGRTFIQPDQKMRDISVRLKLNVLKENVEGKRVVMVDDSIVRGTTSGQIVRLLKDAGAKEVHLRVACPPVTDPCFFGIDTPEKKQLMAARYSVEEMCGMIGADSLGFLSVEGMTDAIGLGRDNVCTACFTGDYPMELPERKDK